MKWSCRKGKPCSSLKAIWIPVIRLKINFEHNDNNRTANALIRCSVLVKWAVNEPPGGESLVLMAVLTALSIWAFPKSGALLDYHPGRRSNSTHQKPYKTHNRGVWIIMFKISIWAHKVLEHDDRNPCEFTWFLSCNTFPSYRTKGSASSCFLSKDRY